MPLPRMTFFSNWASGCGWPLLALVLLPFIAGGLIWIGVVAVPILIIGSIVICVGILSVIYFIVLNIYLITGFLTNKEPSPTAVAVLEPKNAAKIILSIAITIVCIVIFKISGLWGVPLIIFIAYLCFCNKD